MTLERRIEINFLKEDSISILSNTTVLENVARKNIDFILTKEKYPISNNAPGDKKESRIYNKNKRLFYQMKNSTQNDSSRGR